MYHLYLHYLYRFPWFISCILFIAFFIALSFLGLFVVKRFVNTKDFKLHHDVATAVYGVIGVLYAVLLGFTFLTVQNRFHFIHQSTEAEANAVADLFKDTMVFPPEKIKELHSLLRQYVNTVVSIEWPLMVEGKTNQETEDIIQKIWEFYYMLPLTTEKEKIWYERSIVKLNDLLNLRFIRLFSSRETLGTTMWVLLISGSVITNAFIYFFYIKNFRVQAAMIIMLTVLISFMLYLVFDLDNPFLGGEIIGPHHLQNIGTWLNEWAFKQV